MIERIPDDTDLPELTLRGMLLGAVLTVVFTAANIYLGLKVGLTFASSIPAAVISMAVLRRCRGANILENNMVQTQASAAGTLSAIIFILPGLLMIGHWQGFPFWLTAAVCGVGGLLGVLYTIPLRRVMVVDSPLPYPEGVAAAEILPDLGITGRLRLRHVPGFTEKDLLGFLAETVAGGSCLLIDDERLRLLLAGSTAWFVSPLQAEVAPRTGALCRSFEACLHSVHRGGVTVKHLQLYLNEFSFRTNAGLLADHPTVFRTLLTGILHEPGGPDGQAAAPAGRRRAARWPS